LKLKKYDDALKAAEKAVETGGQQAARYKKRIEEIKKAKAEEKK
jgi:hypothetical protein